MVSLKKIALAIATLAVASTQVTAQEENGVITVGTHEALDVQVLAGASRQDVVAHPSASYVAVHFDDFNLPEGDVVIVRSPDSEVSYEYRGRGRADLGSFYASYIPGSKAIVEYFASGAETAASHGYKINGYARGFPPSEQESICGADNSLPAKCYVNGTIYDRNGELLSKLPEAYQKSKAVARLLINGTSLCTGWLAGSEGHMMTNHHCIKTPAHAKVIDIEFDAEGPSCAEVAKCNRQLGCPGRKVATTSEFVVHNQTHDFALVKIVNSTVDLRQYGYLQLRGDGPMLGENIYIPQHPNGKARRIASTIDVVDRDGNAKLTAGYINSLHGMTGCGENQVGYAVDTEGGSSGSPVLAEHDNLVVALHHCGGCNNNAVDIRDVISVLSDNKIAVKDLIVGEPTPAPTTQTPQPPTPTTPAPTTQAPTPAPTGKTNAFCNTFHKKLTCNFWLWCKWDDAAHTCYARANN